MQAIKPLSASDAKLASTVANFPALVHAFESSGISGNTLTDPISGLILNNTTGWTEPESGQFRPASSGSQTITGTWNDPGTNDFLAIVIGNMNTGTHNTVIGNTGVAGIDLRGGGGDFVTGVGAAIYNTQGAVATAPFAGLAIGAAIAGDVITKYSVEDDGAANDSDAGTNTGTLDATTWQPSAAVSLTTNAASWYTGIYVFEFTSGLPTDIAAGLAWMGANPGFIYPGWADRV